MKRKLIDTFFSNLFSRDFLLLILTKHRKNKESNHQFSIYLRNYLLLDEITKRRLFVDDDKDLNFELFVDNDLLDLSINIVVFFIFVIIVVFFLFFNILFFFIFYYRFFSRRFLY